MNLANMVRPKQWWKERIPQNRLFVGYWRSNYDSDLPNPADFIGPMDNRELIAKRLALGDTFAAWLGYSYCRICGVRLGTRCLTLDGTWVWPERLEHYVLDHGLALPPEFVDRLLSFPANLVEELVLHENNLKQIVQASTAFEDCPDKSATCDRVGMRCADHNSPNLLMHRCTKLYSAQQDAREAEVARHKAVMASGVKIPW